MCTRTPNDNKVGLQHSYRGKNTSEYFRLLTLESVGVVFSLKQSTLMDNLNLQFASLFY